MRAQRQRHVLSQARRYASVDSVPVRGGGTAAYARAPGKMSWYWLVEVTWRVTELLRIECA